MSRAYSVERPETADDGGDRANLTRSHFVFDDLDIVRGGIRLRAATTKNRKDGFQHIAHGLMELLIAFGSTGAAKRLYGKYHQADVPDNPLLYVPCRTATASIS